MIEIKDKDRPLFLLQTAHTTYAMKVMENGQLEHLYYGTAIGLDGSDGLLQDHAYPVGSLYNEEIRTISPEDTRYELSSAGKGDLREPMIGVSYADGFRTPDFVYQGYEILPGKPELDGLPSSYGNEQEVETLCLTFKDRNSALVLKMHYSVFAARDVITRSLAVTNTGDTDVTLTRAFSAQLDLDADTYTFHSFNGSWGREMKHSKIPVKAGKIVNDTRTGNSSNRANPFIMISREETCEDHGDCYGFHLVYSGNHAEIAERSPYGKVRVLTGISPEDFAWLLNPSESFTTPEAILCFSDLGFGELSRRLHTFLREHIVRGPWQHKERPVVLNSWEASYFDISETKLFRLARVAKSVGIELFVMDDGWFGHRDDDTSSLGDWVAHPKKLPGGLRGLSDKIRSLGLEFGVWVEPEMVSEDSGLYRTHPDWAMRHPSHEHSFGRHQMILDFCNPDVQNNIIKQMSEVISSSNASYIKWDMNRNFTDVYSPYLPPARQKETAHRYMLGLYRVLKELTSAFPEVLFEGCASGGNRFDPGMLCFFPQIWASDDTDAMERVEIQNGYSYGYPLSCVSAHISDVPNHQTTRRTPLATRFAVAAAGILGYECNLCELGSDELDVIRSQITLYKEWRQMLQFGDYYRGKMWSESGEFSLLAAGTGSDASWTIVSPDKKKAVATEVQLLTCPNIHTLIHRPKGLDPSLTYHMSAYRFRYPKKDLSCYFNEDNPLRSRISKLAKEATAEPEEHTLRGDMLMHAGVCVRPAGGGLSTDENQRFFPDFASRMYFYEA